MDGIVFRRFRAEDYEALCAFLIALNRDKPRHINWNWARFEWMYRHPEFDASLISSIGLWLRGETVVGAAIYDMYFGEAFCGALPEYEALLPGILDYAFRELRDEEGLGVAIRDGCGFEAETALSRGFRPAEQHETVLERELDGLDAVPLPEGFRFAELDPAAEPRAFQWLLWQGFDHGDDREEFEKSLSPIPRNRPHFRRELSLAAKDAAGDYAAYCCLWLHPETDYAYVEPVCTVPACRGRGVGGALVLEALRRARTLGARRAWVISDLDFYRRLGFREAERFSFYWKK